MKPGLILIDIQNDYFEKGNMELVRMDRAAENAKTILAAFRKADLPLFHIQHEAIQPSATFFLPDTPGVEIHASVRPLAGETIIIKHFPNSFRETGLLDHLKKAEVTDVVICGAMSHMCVDATTRAAFDLGFRCLVAEDACATRALAHNGQIIEAEKVHGAFMAALSHPYAAVIPSKECLTKIM
ncbi:MAG: cysteine hydrolase [Deltaproteobacteria bacterium]|nr:cysteine hydrolase [Deltaproteobacteria bacterium]